MKKKGLIDKFVLIVPYLFGFAFIIFCLIYKPVVMKSEGIDNLFNHFITFSSIIVGVLIALFSVLISLDNTTIMKELERVEGEKLLVQFGTETLLSNLMLLVYTVMLQFLVSNQIFEKYLNILISICLGIAITTLVSSIRTTYYFLIVPLNKNNKRIKENSPLTEEDKEKLQKKYSKNQA
ncbi:hypothetical protein [Facklamia sp. 7083-14-GEN3]|uniref:hypothetical protein n=1 Tax=Facklamia sp. 7083-14-GEN3 TaxID=2973478 RepID=UPI00215C9294|nr:hypothetical protein [Facklamia sp. 7083-14-GEN3]MCR8969591.1 hypothetical protein [Facklamia sp. 7083-14-GEN3]